MNYRTGIKILLIFTAFLFTSIAFSPRALASDYQYKVLDPKYNPQAELIQEGSIPPIVEVQDEYNSDSFDFKRFLAIVAAIVFPMFIISLVFRTFREVTEDVPGRTKEDVPGRTKEDVPGRTKEDEKSRIETKEEKLVQNNEKQKIGNIKINPTNAKNIQPQQKEHTSKTASHSLNTSNPVSKTNLDNKVKSAKISPKTEQILKSKPSAGYATTPVHTGKKNPMLLNTAKLSSNKGLCLVEYDKKYSLIGYIGNEIFLLNQFSNLSSKEIRPRLSENLGSKERYIVRLGSYKALLEVSDTKMNLLLEL